MNERAARESLVDYSRRLHARGWVANHDGNVTLRLGTGRYLATPTAMSKAAVGAGDLIVVTIDAERAGGVKPLPDGALPALLESRRKAGLGPRTPAGQAANRAVNPAANAAPKPVVACAPAPHSDVTTISPGKPSDLATIIREE